MTSRDRIGTTLFLVALFLACESITPPTAPQRGLALTDCDPPPPPPPPAGADSFPVPIMDGDGLYGGGWNEPAGAHLTAGLAAAATMPATPLIVSLGMSTTQMGFTYWQLEAQASEPNAVFANTAAGGMTVSSWDNAAGAGWTNALSVLANGGRTGADVDVVWMMLVRGTAANPSKATADDLENVLVQINNYYPNVKQIFVDSYPYGGYHKNGSKEPDLWEGGIEVRDFITAHQGESDPWIGWGPYLWANGDAPRSDGLVWLREDYNQDGIHPSPSSGRPKLGALLEAFFQSSPVTEWYR